MVFIILVIGTEGCSRCAITQKILTEKDIDYEYKTINSLPVEDRRNYVRLAKDEGLNTMPLIIQNNKAISLQELLEKE